MTRQPEPYRLLDEYCGRVSMCDIAVTGFSAKVVIPGRLQLTMISVSRRAENKEINENWIKGWK
jgi:hypothetical protein